MDMRSVPDHPRLGELFDRLVDEGGDFLQAEMRIVEAKLTRRARMAAVPIGQLAVAIALALIALMALAAALVVALAPVIGFALAALIVAILAAGSAYALYRAGSGSLGKIFEMPQLFDKGGQ